MNPAIRPVQYGTPAYEETVALRYEILRKPLHLTFDPEHLKKEHADFHIAAYLENELAACLVLSPLENNIIKMRQVAVNQHFQNKGIGKKLVLFAEDFAAENGYKKMILNARETAVDFYLNMNYTITDAPFTEVGIPHRKMQKAIKTGN